MNILIQLCQTCRTSEKAYIFKNILCFRRASIKNLQKVQQCIIHYNMFGVFIAFVYTSAYTQIFSNHIFCIVKLCNFFLCILICFCWWVSILSVIHHKSNVKCHHISLWFVTLFMYIAIIWYLPMLFNKSFVQ